MLATIIAIIIVAGVILWATKTTKKPTASKFETKEEEPIGYVDGVIVPVLPEAPVEEAPVVPELKEILLPAKTVFFSETALKVLKSPLTTVLCLP